MENLFYVPGLRITPRIADTVMIGHHIIVGEQRFERVSKRPTGRRVLRKLVSMNEKERIVLYS